MPNTQPRRPKGEGSIYQRKDGNGRWECRVELGKGATGQRRRVTVYGATKREALAALRDLLGKQSRGQLVVTPKLTVAEFLDHWLTTVIAPSREPQTLLSYRSIIQARLLPLLGELRLSKLDAPRLQAAFAELAKHYAASTVHQTRTVLHGALEQAVDWGLLATNPTAKLKLPRRAPAHPQFLAVPDAQRLLQVALTPDEHYGPFYALALTTGLRLGELLALRWEDVDWEQGLLRVRRSVGVVAGARPITYGKTAAGVRELPLLPIHRAALQLHARHWGDPEGWLWPGAWPEQPLRPETVREGWQRFCRRHGLPPLKIHGLRHSTASLLVSLGIPINVVAAILGHSSATVTLNVYSHVLPDAKAQALAQLDALLGWVPEE